MQAIAPPKTQPELMLEIAAHYQSIRLIERKQPNMKKGEDLSRSIHSLKHLREQIAELKEQLCTAPR